MLAAVALYALLLVTGPFVASSHAEPADIKARGGGAVDLAIVGVAANTFAELNPKNLSVFTPTNATFGFQVKGYDTFTLPDGHVMASSLDGNLEFQDHNLGLAVHVGGPGTSIDGVSQVGGCVWFWGTARVQQAVNVGGTQLARNAIVFFLVDACDLGEPGTSDTFVITLATQPFNGGSMTFSPGVICYRAGLSNISTADVIDRGNIQVGQGNEF